MVNGIYYFEYKVAKASPSYVESYAYGFILAPIALSHYHNKILWLYDWYKNDNSESPLTKQDREYLQGRTWT